MVPPWFNQRADSIQTVRRLHSTAITGEPVPAYSHALLPRRDAKVEVGIRVFRPARSRVSFRKVRRRRSHLARRSLRSACTPLPVSIIANGADYTASRRGCQPARRCGNSVSATADNLQALWHDFDSDIPFDLTAVFGDDNQPESRRLTGLKLVFIVTGDGLALT